MWVQIPPEGPNSRRYLLHSKHNRYCTALLMRLPSGLTGSSPVCGASISSIFYPVSSTVERRLDRANAVGSIPTLGTKIAGVA